jgi:glycosyltransferase involved in cell wall biosynthesis
MKKSPLVTIVTPSYNQAAFLERTICSVLAQTYPHIQYIVMDGDSTDESLAIIKKYRNKISHFVSQKDQGQTDAINKGFSLARGDILAWLNADDTYLPHAVARAVECLQSDSSLGMVYGDAHYIDENDRTIGRFPSAQTDLKRLKRGYVHIPQQSSFFRADLWRQVAPLDPSFYFAMDYDLWVRLAKRSQLKFVPEVWANFRLHSDAKTIMADDRCWPEMLRVHFREGGSIFSIIGLKYLLRRLAAPLITHRRNRLFIKSDGE